MKRIKYPNSERGQNFYTKLDASSLATDGLSEKHSKNFARKLGKLSGGATRAPPGMPYDWVWLSPNKSSANRTPWNGKGDPCKSSKCKEHVHGVVLHTTEGWGASASGFSRPSRGASAHYSVERDGSVVLIVPEKDIAWHAGTGVNNWSVGIEITGFSIDRNKAAYGLPSFGMPKWQVISLAKLVAGILKRWNLKPSRKTVFGHAHVGGCGSKESSGKVVPYKPNLKGRGGGKGCHYDPGDNFPWNRFMRLVKYYYYRPLLITGGVVSTLAGLGLGGFLLFRSNPTFLKQIRARREKKRLMGE